MHEVGVIDEIIQTVLEEIRPYPDSQVKSVKLKIGKFRQFVPEIMRFCYNVAGEDTRLSGSELLLEEIPIRIVCMQCRNESVVEEYDFVCPHCNSMSTELITGNELILESIELSEPQMVKSQE